MNKKPTMNPPDLTGVIFITGESGVGKSTLATQADFPNQIAFLDFDSKGIAFHKQLEFNQYHDLTASATKTSMVFTNFLNFIENLEKDSITTVIIDNVSPLEDGMRACIKENVKEYSKTFDAHAGNIMSGAMGGASGVANKLLSTLIDKLHDKGVHLIIAIAHVSNAWGGGGIIPGKLNTKGLGRWNQLASGSFIVVPATEDSSLRAIVVKKEAFVQIASPDPSKLSPAELKAIQTGEVGHSMKSRLPKRIPPDANFQKIRHYFANPADLNNPAEGEALIMDEFQPYTGSFTPLQKEVLLANAAIARKDEGANQTALEELKTIVTDEMKTEVKEKFDNGATLPDLCAEYDLSMEQIIPLIQ